MPGAPTCHVGAVDRQTSGSKMLINLTGSAAMLLALIWNSDWWIGALWGSQGESHSYQFTPHFQCSSTTRHLSQCHSHTQLRALFFCSPWEAKKVLQRNKNKIRFQEVSGFGLVSKMHYVPFFICSSKYFHQIQHRCESHTMMQDYDYDRRLLFQ